MLDPDIQHLINIGEINEAEGWNIQADAIINDPDWWSRSGANPVNIPAIAPDRPPDYIPVQIEPWHTSGIKDGIVGWGIGANPQPKESTMPVPGPKFDLNPFNEGPITNFIESLTGDLPVIGGNSFGIDNSMLPLLILALSGNRSNDLLPMILLLGGFNKNG